MSRSPTECTEFYILITTSMFFSPGRHRSGTSNCSRQMCVLFTRTHRHTRTHAPTHIDARTHTHTQEGFVVILNTRYIMKCVIHGLVLLYIK